MDPEKITYFAETDARNKRVRFGIKAKDRTKHMYVIGKTGMGKSFLLENLAIQDIQNGEGLAFIDPHGGTAEKLLEYVPEHRIKDVLYFAPFDLENPVSFNVLEDIGADKRHLVVNGLMSTFEKIWVDAWSARMAYILQYTLLALLEFPGATLLSVNRVLVDKEYRKKVVDNVKDPSVRAFWIEEFGKYTERFAAEATPAIQNKVGQFTSNALVRNLIGQPDSSFDIRKFMDEKKILIINLSKGLVGEGNANLIGSMLITKIYLAAMSRADKSEQELAKLPNFYLYVDEFQSFANKSFADILSEARKYKLNLTIAHQYVEQMEEEVRDAVFGNAGTIISFRVGAFDSEVLEKEFAPVFTAENLVNLGKYQIYLKLMIDGVASQPFSATTMPGIVRPDITFKNEVIESSRKQFTHPRVDVEKAIQDWHDEGTARAQPKAVPQNSGGNGNGVGSNNVSGNINVSGDAVINYRPNFEKKSDGGFEPRRENRSDRPSSLIMEPAQDKSLEGSNDGNSEKNSRPERPKLNRYGQPIYSEDSVSKVDQNKIAFAKAAEDLRLKPTNEVVNKSPERREKISLTSLGNDSKKNPSVQNMSSLKDALAGVLSKSKTEIKPEVKKEQALETKNQPEPKVESQEKVKEEVKLNSINSEKTTVQPKKDENINGREVPEEVLRGVLNMTE